jgi:hypothetical protein
LTEEGRVEFLVWLRELLREPVKEYTQFAAGLSFIAALPPGEAAALLGKRVGLLEGQVGRMRSDMDAVMQKGVPRLFLVETEHELVLREAELEWVRGLVREIRVGTLGGLDGWASFHPQAAGPGREEGG